MKVADILEHFLSRAAWVERQSTVDRVIIGDAQADVERCLVTWMPGVAALREAVHRGIRLVICHEPTFWDHWDRLGGDDPLLQEKRLYIEAHDLVILRNHDCWDRWPEVGIPWAWRRFLGLPEKPAATDPKSVQHRYDIPPTSLGDFAREVARRCQTIGEEAVQVTGDLSQAVSRIGAGTGCYCDLRLFQRLGCDCSIVVDDGSCYWEGIQRARDFGHAVIRVNHGTSEEPGMVTLAEYINTHISGLRAEHLPHGCSFRLVGGWE